MTVAIVIFGAAVRPDGAPSTALRRRVTAALAFGERRPDTLYIPTGGVGRHPPAEAQVMAALLAAAGIPPHRILPEPTGRNTIGSVRAVRRLLRDRPVRLVAATDRYHLPRCLMLLRFAGFSPRACPPPPGPASRHSRRRWFWRLRECLAVPVDAVLAAWLRAVGRF